ncbi:alpha/beta fold hydrolase [Actinokineospora pegani]|uniref:alpha/beta fold hydrolase n=1 Tax=Actinokineospora pegani TaxID=2654637 RepID=UPI0012EAAA07|nr:alpha/beta hydrolase [Actinokineospora pegani]
MIDQRIVAAYEDMLGDVERITVPTRFGDTFVAAAGPADGPVVVLVHGSGANTAMWQVGEWAARHRVYALDIPGEPGLSVDNRLPMGEHVDWLDDVLGGLGVREAAFVGMSLGGWLVLDYAQRRADRVTRLVLLNPAGLGRMRAGFILKAVFFKLLGERGLRMSLRAALGEVPPAQVEYLSLVFRHFSPRADVPVLGPLALTMPVLAVVGDHDAMLDGSLTARRLRAEVPHARVDVVDAGHLLPDQTATALEFLEES